LRDGKQPALEENHAQVIVLRNAPLVRQAALWQRSRPECAS
jgi:hypothetical protein